jgi:cytochrome d ubiquinol oxidase subunit II
MFLATLPLLICWAAAVLYTVLAGADYGAGFWQLVAGRGRHARHIRDHAHHAMGPVWEANHVWLVLILTVAWTAYPRVFASIASTLCVPLFLAGVGIVLRGLLYMLQGATSDPRERRVIDTIFALASILAPFMLGAAVGGIATGRVPLGNAAGNLVTSWTNPTSLLTGALAVAVSAYLAAVYLAADARRFPTPGLGSAFRVRALTTGALTGAVALAGLGVVSQDDRGLFDGLTGGWGLAAVIISGVAGLASLTLVWLCRFEGARVVAALAVAALIAGWAAAQRPDVLPGVSLRSAAADNATLLAVVIAVAAGVVILGPSLALLFRLFLGGRLDADPLGPRAAPPAREARRPAWAARAALACFIAGFLLLTVAEAPAAHAFGVVAFAGAALAAFTAVGPDELAAHRPDSGDRGAS